MSPVNVHVHVDDILSKICLVISCPILSAIRSELEIKKSCLFFASVVRLYICCSRCTVVVEFLNDASGILDNLLVSLGLVDSERLDNATNAHLFKSTPTLFVNAEIADREEGDAARRL